ncbi:hypothetical protein, partial [Hoeflea sp.]|uniref:hypothetical protein n=1 Tax=Hoeflea sp. TaxID=1940281 RepID=UPI0025BD4231
MSEARFSSIPSNTALTRRSSVSSPGKILIALKSGYADFKAIHDSDAMKGSARCGAFALPGQGQIFDHVLLSA